MIIGTQDREICRQQAEMGAKHGFLLDGYQMLYWHYDIPAQVQEGRNILAGFTIETFWLDCECDTGSLTTDQVCELIQQAVDEALKGGDIGIYTGAWWWIPYTGNTTRFSQYKVWLAVYDGKAILESVSFGGWDMQYAHQYAADVKIGGELTDLDIIRQHS